MTSPASDNERTPPRRGLGLVAPPLLDTLSATQRDRRARIIDAGLLLLRHHDHTQIQMKDVAAEAGVALGTVYRYFQSKDHLFGEILVSWARELRTNVERRPLQGRSNAERLSDILHRALRAFQAWPQLARVVMDLESSEDPFVREIFARNNADNMTVFVEALQGLPDSIALDIVRTAVAVFDLQLRRWIVGAQSIADAYDRIDRACWLLLEFSDPTEGRARAGDR